MSVESNKAVVRSFFKDVLDKGDIDLLDELFTADCLIYRPESPEPIKGLEGIRRIVKGANETFSSFSTKLYDIFGEGERIACRLSHTGVYLKEKWKSRLGEYPVAGKEVTWGANVIFRLVDGKITEEWVSRDEAGIIVQVSEDLI